jgi:hypothetical protein
MTAAKLKELVDAMEREKYDTQEWHNARFMLQSYLTGHAQDFLRLMEAAELILDHCGHVVVDGDEGTAFYADDTLRSALAAFKEKS